MPWMNKIWLIFKREYLTRVKKVSFVITTLLVPLSFVFMFGVTALLAVYGTDDMRIAVKDDNYKVVISDVHPIHFIPTVLDIHTLKSTYKRQNFDGVLHIPKFDWQKSQQTAYEITYLSDKPLGLSAKSYIQNEMKAKLKEMKLAHLGIDNTVYNQLKQVKVEVKEKSTSLKAINNQNNTDIATLVGMGMGFLMYIVIFIYGSMVMRGVMEEKTNRIVEVILSSVKPFKLMIGKILGIGAVGLTQFSIWIVLIGTFYLIIGLSLLGTGAIDINSAQTSTSLTDGGMMGQTDINQAQEIGTVIMAQFHRLPWGKLVVGFLFYFVWGYILYAAIFASLGSAINDETDAQTLTFPASIPVIVSVIILTTVVEQPNSSLAVWSSIIPLFSPIIMPFRIAFGVPNDQLALSMILLVIGALCTVWLAGKIYRTAILMYGKKITFTEIAKWMLRS